MSVKLSHGARFALKRRGLTEEVARYEVSVETPGGETVAWQVAVTTAEGSFELGAPEDEALEPWMVTWATTLLAKVARDGARKGTWARLLRQWKARPDSPA